MSKHIIKGHLCAIDVCQKPFVWHTEETIRGWFSFLVKLVRLWNCSLHTHILLSWLATLSVHTQTDRPENQHPMKISVHRGITVSWHDNLLFKCITALFSPTMEHCRQLIHYHWVPFLFPSPSLSLCHTHQLPSSHRPLPRHSLAGVPQCEKLIMFCYWTCKLNWTESLSPGLHCAFVWVSMHMHTCLCLCVWIPVCVISGE